MTYLLAVRPLTHPSRSTPVERIVVYFDHIGGLEGSVVRVFEGGFAMQFKMTAHKRKSLPPS